MRYGIFSDVHSNLEALEAVISAYRGESIDKYLCVGDVVGYGANPKECIEKVRTIAMITIAGNHDWATVNLFSVDYFNPAAKEAVFWTRNILDQKDAFFLESLKLTYKNEDFTLVHGTLDRPQDFNYMIDGFAAKETFRLLETNICFVGHTHVAGVFMKDRYGRPHYEKDASVNIKPGNKYIINTGSVGQPRDGNPKAAYCVYDTEKKSIQIKRVDYDMKLARKKIMEAGLPQFLADRIIMGR
jgi:predicted phosphodiesterase